MTAVIGMGVGFGGLLIGFLMEGGHLTGLMGLSAFLIVVGGTIGAVITSFSIADIVKVPSIILKEVLGPSNFNETDIINMLVTFSEKARREGLLALEEDIDSTHLSDPILKKGIKLVVDGTDPEIISSLLFKEIEVYELQQKHKIAIFEAAGGFSPTMGIIGTVMGLIHVLGALTQVDKLGPAIALAFVATLYGVALANLVYLPFANKIKLKTKNEVLLKELMAEGISAIQSGDNPILVRERLVTYILDKDKITNIE